MSDSKQESASSEAIPQAVIRTPEQVASGRLKTRLWWLTGLCAILALVLVVSSFQSQGMTVTLYFDDGHGLKAGDTVRYRGIDVGAVQSVQIGKDLEQIVVQIQLSPGHERVAVEGSQFWIERARLRVGQISGLDTVVGAKYIGVRPGDPQASLATEFDGLESPLNLTRGDSQDIRIEFPAGEGLAVGDAVRYRGISVGEVMDVELSESIDSVFVSVRLVGSARGLARAGTQFWIERPRIDLTEVRGLETLLGGRYIAMQPTLRESETQSKFTGLAAPPPLLRRDGSLEVELDAANRMGLVRGAPIIYRGLEVGRISNVGLASDGATVKIRAVIDASYADLLRDNSKWWAVGGVKIDANLRGVQITIDSLSSWLRGGVAFATPESPGERVVTGHRYVLEPEPQTEWLDWQPRIPVGSSQSAERPLPVPLRVVASWRNSILGLYQRRTVESWAVAGEGRRLYVPQAFVDAAREAGTDVQIEIAGSSFVFNPGTVRQHGANASLLLPNAVDVSISKVDMGRWTSDSVLLIVNPELSDPMAVDDTRVAIVSNGLEIAPGVPIAEALEGSPVVEATSGELIGLLVSSPDGWRIATFEDPDT